MPYTSCLPCPPVLPLPLLCPRRAAGGVLHGGQLQGSAEERHPQRQPHHLLRARTAVQRQGCDPWGSLLGPPCALVCAQVARWLLPRFALTCCGAGGGRMAVLSRLLLLPALPLTVLSVPALPRCPRRRGAPGRLLPVPGACGDGARGYRRLHLLLQPDALRRDAGGGGAGEAGLQPRGGWGGGRGWGCCWGRRLAAVCMRLLGMLAAALPWCGLVPCVVVWCSESWRPGGLHRRCALVSCAPLMCAHTHLDWPRAPPPSPCR